MKVERVFDCHCGAQPILMRSSTDDKYVKNYWFCCPKCGMRNKESDYQFDLDPEGEATYQWNKMIIKHRARCMPDLRV